MMAVASRRSPRAAGSTVAARQIKGVLPAVPATDEDDRRVGGCFGHGGGNWVWSISGVS